MVLRKGGIYGIDFSPGNGAEPRKLRPGLVLQRDVLNDSRLDTGIVAAIFSTMNFGELPGNVALRKGDANAPEGCVVNLAQLKSLDKSSVRGFIGMVSENRRIEVREGLKWTMDL